MGSVILAARIVLAVVFITAAVGKLIDLRGSREAVAGFGVPDVPAAALGTLLPFFELATAVALVFRPTARWGALVALVLLLGFIAGMANSLRQGDTVECHCFGAIHSAPVSWRQILRNAILAAAAVLVIGWGSGPAVDSWISARSAAELVAVAAGIAAIVLLAVAIQQWLVIRRLRAALVEAQEAGGAGDGLRIGARAPSFELPDADGVTVSLDSLQARGLPVLLLFMSAGCGPCEALLPEMERLRTTVADRLTIGLIGRSTIDRYVSAREARPEGMTLPEARAQDEVLDRDLISLVELFSAYRLTATPSAVVVSPEGTIASATVDGHPAIEALIRLTLDERPYSAEPPAALEPSAV